MLPQSLTKKTQKALVSWFCWENLVTVYCTNFIFSAFIPLEKGTSQEARSWELHLSFLLPFFIFFPSSLLPPFFIFLLLGSIFHFSIKSELLFQELNLNLKQTWELMWFLTQYRTSLYSVSNVKFIAVIYWGPIKCQTLWYISIYILIYIYDVYILIQVLTRIYHVGIISFKQIKWKLQAGRGGSRL